MGFFSKKEKVPVTTNNLCIHITEDKLNKKAYKSLYLNHTKNTGFTKKTQPRRKDEFIEICDSFCEDIEKQFPWVKRWTLSQVSRANHTSEYYLVVLEHTLDGINI